MHTLQLTVQQLHQLFVILGIELDKHRIRACGEMTLHHLGDVLQLLHHVLVHRTLLQVDAHVGTGAVAQTLRVHVEAAARDDIGIDEVLHTLMDGCTRHIALGSHILEGDTGILGQNAQNLLV